MTCWGGFNVLHSKFSLWRDKEPRSIHSRDKLFATLWTVVCQALLSMRFSRQEYWTGLPFPSPGNFLTQGSNSGVLSYRQSPALQADSSPTEPLGKPHRSHLSSINSHLGSWNSLLPLALSSYNRTTLHTAVRMTQNAVSPHDSCGGAPVISHHRWVTFQHLP